jgi:tRNA (guanine-N7-)-methyltransferase
MRMRKKKNGEARLNCCAEFILEPTGEPMADPAAEIGMPGAPVLLEIGAGKGGFAVKMAERYSDSAYFAMEKVTDCVVLAAEKAKARAREGGADNLRFIIDTADNLTKIFEVGTVDKIFLNFSDPWSKKGYAKRRLTHRRYLSVYFNLLRDGGALTFKTDNVGLFDFSLLEIAEMGLKPDFVTRDLHNCARAADNIMTEYETAFSEQGMAINMVEVTKPRGYSPEIPENLRRDRKSYFKNE